MGSTGSKYFKRASPSKPTSNNNYPESSNVCVKRPAVNLFSGPTYVLSRQGSMYFDSDGDLAHEFYVEVKTKHRKKRMKRILNDLKPQGEVVYPYPRLHPDYPVVLMHV
ncbi:unnamed protein product [Bemisia tabaci]|uniref:Tumor suppressor candidate 2 n=1 Tax=Bemisia tabaci TaxID=7038 RepID=A0A9P0F2M1_BEMTA|nr:PREDICTED: tumor suppressor candidate 2-like [Bemisia tabaci]CAH0389316.1 unnamed protein product [Bemisia tabaci]